MQPTKNRERVEILIFSRSEDQTTLDVVRWIRHLEQNSEIFLVHSDAIKNNQIYLTPKEVHIHLDQKSCSLGALHSVWYRKGGGQITVSTQPEITSNTSLNGELKTVTQRDTKRTTEYIHYIIKKHKRVLGAYGKGNLNKLITLSMARDSGLMTPDFLISNKKEDFSYFIKKHKQAISKGISDGLYFFDSDNTHTGYFNYTSRIDTKTLENYDHYVPTSLVQEMIEKKYEVRAFFLLDEFYSTAIFSQDDEQTKVDYRRYNAKTPNRTVPYKLPREIEEKLLILFKKLELNTGSVDLIVDVNNNYIFLEINPVGQFGNHSSSCNYNLEQKIAKVLLHGKQ
jgi:ATP-GRASP peptide maturase of grasp-with-spasm system